MELKSGMKVIHRNNGTHGTLVSKMRDGLNAWNVRVHGGVTINWWTKNIAFLPTTNEDALSLLKKEEV